MWPSQRIVREFREAMTWTQREAAEWYGVAERTWRRWEHGERQAPTPLLKRIEGRVSGTLRQHVRDALTERASTSTP